jgi:DNA modification methylase
MGSGTTLSVAQRMNRNSIGIDIVDDYCKKVANGLGVNVNSVQLFSHGGAR